MDFQSQIELKVKVLDQELDALEKRIQKFQNPFTSSGTKRKDKTLAAAKAAQKAELQLVQQAVDAEDKLRETKAQKRVQTNLRRIRYLKNERLKAAREVANAEQAAARQRAALSRRIGNGIASAGIGGAFPFLFGQGGAGAIGGAAGGLAGGLIGGQFGFALSLIGTALGDAVQKSDDLNKSIAGLNASFDIATTTVSLTRSEINNLAEDLSVANDEAVTLLSSFSAFTGPEALELARAFADIGGVGTAEAAVKARLGEKEALEAINSLRSTIGNKEADSLLKVLEIKGAQAASAALLDALLEKQKNITTETQNTVTFWDQVQARVASITAALSGVGNPAAAPTAQDFANDRANAIPGADKGVIGTALNNLERFYRESQRLQEKYKPLSTGKGSKAPESKALQLQQQLVREELKRAGIAVKYVKLVKDEKTAIEAQQQLIQQRLIDETRIIELQRQRALAQNKVAEDVELINRLYDSRLATLDQQLGLEQATNDERLRAIKLEKELQGIKNTQELAGISTGLTRQIEDTQFRTNNPFGGDAVEQRELQIQQNRRYADLLTEIADKEELVNAAVRSRLKNGKEATPQQAKELEQLARKKALYAELIPQLNEAEQAELRMAQTLEKLSPVTNALASGLSNMITGLVDGTKSAEEALSEMFKNIGAAFIQMATEMIAQALVMKALGILMPGGGAGGGSGLNLAGVASYMPGGSSYEGGGYTGNAPRSGGVDGRGGFPAILHPNETVIDHESAMGKYSPGGGGAGGGSRTIRFESTVINSIEYVTRDEAVAMSRQAANDGAKRGAAGGHSKTMSTLQNSRSSRARLGMR